MIILIVFNNKTFGDQPDSIYVRECLCVSGVNKEKRGKKSIRDHLPRDEFMADRAPRSPDDGAGRREVRSWI